MIGTVQQHSSSTFKRGGGRALVRRRVLSLTEHAPRSILHAVGHGVTLTHKHVNEKRATRSLEAHPGLARNTPAQTGLKKPVERQ